MTTDHVARVQGDPANRPIPGTWRLPATWRIYIPITGLAAVLVVAGFWPTYFGPLLTGTGTFRHPRLLHGMPVVHIHAAVYMGWLALVIAQGYLAATRRTALHVKLGQFGFPYGVVVILLGLFAAFDGFALRIYAGDVPGAQRALLAPFTDMIGFSLLLGAAWLYRHRPDIHKRLIVVATTLLIIAGVGRLPFWHGTRIMSFREVVPFLVVWLSPIYIAMAHDYIRRRIVHPVYVTGLIALALIRMRPLLLDTDAWLGFSGWLAKFFLSVSFIAVLGAGSLSVAAEPNLLPGKPNIWGIWLGTDGYRDIDPRYRSQPWPQVEFTPWGAAQSKRLETPPTHRDACAPRGPIGHLTVGGHFPLEIARATKGVVMMLEVAPLPRRIYTDGRQHPEDLDPTWLGHSVAHWEGDTLIVDTIGVNGRTAPINGYVANAVHSKTETAPRLPVSEQLHMTERIRVVGDDEYLENEITIDDPKTYKHPFTVKRYWQRRPDLELFEHYCDDDRGLDSRTRTGSSP